MTVRRVVWLVVRLVLAVVSVVSFGFLSFLPGVVAGAVERSRRRRWLLWGLAAATAAVGLTGGTLLASVSDADEDRVLTDDVGFLMVLAAMAAGIAAAALLRTPPSRAERYDDVEDLPGVQRALDRRALRERFRQLVAEDPALALELGVGRPDRRPALDDGGLLDLNALSAEALVQHAHLSKRHAASVVDVRTRLGRLTSVDEVVVHGLLDLTTAARLRDRAVFLPPA